MSALFERADFTELVDATAANLGVNPAIVEKDYYVTEALRAIASVYGEAVMFKGGTSLSKGWGLIDRFSEDIDLYIEPAQRGAKARNTLLKTVINTAAAHAAFSGEVTKVGGINGVARAARIAYRPCKEMAFVAPSVLIELGTQSGTFPHETREISSILAAQLKKAGTAPNQRDCQPFPLKLLHFRRTVVEKMFALHDKVERGLIQRGHPIGSYARHYYDLSQLVMRPEVWEMLSSSEYVEIVRDYTRVTSKYFPNQAFPEYLELARSRALFPSPDIIRELKREYDDQCSVLCYRDFPEFTLVLGLFEEIRRFLVRII